MKYDKILEIKKGIKILIDLLNFKGEERISLTKSDLMEYLEAIETLEVQKNELLMALKARITDDLAAGADSAEYLETTIYKVLEEVFDVKCVPVDAEANITVMILDAPKFFEMYSEYPEEFMNSFFEKKEEYGAITLKEEFTDAVDTENSVIFRIIRKYLEDVDLDDYGLSGVEITEDDCKTIYERLARDYDVLNLSEVIDQYLREIREVLDNGLAEQLPNKLTLTMGKELPEEVDGDVIGDYLSNTYGFCHRGFNYELCLNDDLEYKVVEVTNIQWDTTD